MHLSSSLAAITFSVALTALPTTASAIPFDLSYDPQPNLTVSSGAPVNVDFTLPGFDGSLHKVDTATLSIELSDDGGSEDIQYMFDSAMFDQNNTGNSDKSYAFDFGALNILSTLNDGVLHVVLSVTSPGDSYFFNSASLTGDYSRIQPEGQQQDVPEPTTLALMGIVLLGAGLAGRRLV